VPVDTF